MTDIKIDYEQAKKRLLANIDETCLQFFAKSAYSLEYSYCLLLKDDLEGAKQALKYCKDYDIRAHWLDFLISLIELRANGFPTYFQLRNFYEIDLNILLHYYKGNYVENILRYSDSMYSVNPEIYKFIGRVMYNNGYTEQAMFFLEKAKNYFYNDPELHYLMAFIYYNSKNYSLADKALDCCLQILPKYFPALDMKDKLKSFS
jgi:tetratricopeptide (TPR) repeat protein